MEEKYGRKRSGEKCATSKDAHGKTGASENSWEDGQGNEASAESHARKSKWQ
jgi:hypothetical protein